MQKFLKVSIALIVGLFLYTNSYAQDYSIDNKKAIKCYEAAKGLYNNVQLEESLISLEEAIEKEPGFIEAHLLMSQIYSELNKLDEAIVSLEKSIDINPSFFPTANFFLGEMHLTQGDYTNALKAFETFLGYNLNDDISNARANLGVENCYFASKAMENPVPFKPINLGPNVNSEFPEYFPCITADDQTILFTRLIDNSRAYNGKHEDFYVASKNEDGWDAAYNLEDVNSILNEGAPTLSPDGQILIFTACESIDGTYGPGKNGMGSCDIFYSQKVGQRWSEPTNLGTGVNTGYWESQPSFAADGETLYFVRGKYTRAGIAKQDIYTSKLVNGTWTKASKIKGEVNTQFEEESVMIHPDGKTLYFSSNGHPGMGGMDIYMSKLKENGEWGTPLNLGYPINTFGNENSVLVAANGKLAYFASDREGGYGDMDIYSFELPENVQADYVTYMKGLVIDAKSFKKLGAKFELIDLESKEMVVSNYSNDVSGEFLVCIPTDRDYALNVSRDGYLFYSDNFSLKGYNLTEPYFKEIELNKIRQNAVVVLKNVFFDTNAFDLDQKSHLELDKLVALLENNPELNIEISGHTDNVGKVDTNLILSEKRASSVVDYLVSSGIPISRLSFKGYGESEPIATNDTAKGKALNRRTEFRIL